MEAIPPLWTLDDLAKFLRIDHLPRARQLSQVSELRRDRGFPKPLIAGRHGGNPRYDPVAIAAWLRRQRGDDAGHAQGQEVVHHDPALPLPAPETGFNLDAFDR